MLDNIIYILLKLMLTLMGMLPRGWLNFFSNALALFWYQVDKRHRNIAEQNISASYPGRFTKAGLASFVKENFRHTASILFEVIWAYPKSKRTLFRYFKVKNRHYFSIPHSRGRPIVLLTGHMGNFELLVAAFPRAGVEHCYGVYRKFDFRPLERLVLEMRQRFGARLIPIGGAAGTVETVLSNGGIVGTMLDQNAGWYNGVVTDYFNRPACTKMGLAKLVRRTNAAVVPLFMSREKDYYTIEFLPEIPWQQTGCSIKDIENNTQAYVSAIEATVRKKPEQYFWVHNRWKTRPSSDWPHAKPKALGSHPESQPLRIKAFWDTRAGHVKQTRGIINALERLTPVQVTDVHLPAYGAGRVFKDWTGLVFSLLMPKTAAKNPAADLIIGTGTHTHIPMIREKRQNRGKIVTCMTPEWPLTSFMDLCFVPEHDRPRHASNISVTSGPPNTGRNLNRHDVSKGLIVVGGIDPKTHFWDSEKMIGYITDLLETCSRIKWTVSTSPRTPPEMTDELEHLKDRFLHMTFEPFEKTPPGWIEDQYANNAFVWVTEDSVSMVYEALSAGCRVGVLPVDWKTPDNKIAAGIWALKKKNKIAAFKEWQLNQVWPESSGMDEAGRCAEEILRRWWPDRLQ